ncbi:hypothetical protein B5G20_08055 [Collinsella sp. An7]|uniref:hypothetical protein n=1 Tax=Collinsella sp. An7 TaxID=1965651 RepID=UPI000B3AF2D5|nr:hypothetical protein [Collinsella sp. An7]OUN46524.1 hypothetical protein B5G20_08055 [Collinsella sp. An7]
MERYPERLYVRLAREDKERAQEVAGAMGLSLSDLVRLMVRLAAADPGLAARAASEGGPIVLDTATCLRIARELRRWGYHYNQGVHALNSVAFHLRHGSRDYGDMAEALRDARAELSAVNGAAGGLCREMASLTGRAALFL